MYAESELKSLLDLAHEAGATMTVVLDQKLYAKEGREVIDIVTIHGGIPGIGRHPASGFAMCEALRAAKAKGHLGPVVKSVTFQEIRGTGQQRAYGHYSTGEVLPICDFDPDVIELSENELVNLTKREAYALFQHKLTRATARPTESMRG
jgi:hypothetical protein